MYVLPILQNDCLGQPGAGTHAADNTRRSVTVGDENHLHTRQTHTLTSTYYVITVKIDVCFRAQELCESRGGRPGSPS